jgi:hypothetical protein
VVLADRDKREAPMSPLAGERRRVERGTSSGEPPRPRLVTMIESTYREMPGLSVRLDEAARLFGLRESTCQVVLDDLVRDGRLRQSRTGRYLAP